MQDCVPLPIAFIRYSTIAARYDLEPKGPTYVEQEMLAAMERLERTIAPESTRKSLRRRRRKNTRRK